MTNKKKHWYSYLWIWSIIYSLLGLGLLISYCRLYLLSLEATNGSATICAEGDNCSGYSEERLDVPEKKLLPSGYRPNGSGMDF